MLTTIATNTMRVNEPTMRFPTGRLLGAAALGGAAGVAGVYLASLVPNWDVSFNIAAVIGAGLVVVIATLATLVMTPWVRRPMSAWMTMWLAGTVMRLLLTPLAAVLLYSATTPDRTTFGLSIGLSYLLALLIEAGVLARFVHQKLSAADSSPRSE